MKRMTVFGWVALAAICQAHFAYAVTICVDAESALTNESPMVLVKMDAPPPGIHPVGGASNATYLEVPLGVGKAAKGNTGTAKITVDVPADGAYNFWFRTCWEGECSNTILVQIDSQPPFLVGADATYHVWHWVKYPVSKMIPQLIITRGTHTLTIIHREDGIRLDQLLLTSSLRYVPVGIEKAGVRP